MNADLIHSARQITTFFLVAIMWSAQTIAQDGAVSDDNKDVQETQRVQRKDVSDPVTMALKAAVRNGSMDEDNARQIYALLAKGVPGSSSNVKAEAYLEEVAAKIDAAVAAGKLSPEDAEAKMNAVEEQIASKTQAASRFAEEIASRMQSDGMSKTEAYLDLAAEKLDEIVQTGELSAADAEAKLIAVEKRTVFNEQLASKVEAGQSKAEAYLELTAATLERAVQSGELSAEDAEAKLIALEKQIADKQEAALRQQEDAESNSEDYLEQVAMKLQEMVKAGKLSAEEADAKLIALENSIAAKNKPGSLDARTVLRAAKRVDLNRDQKDEIRDIEQETIGLYRKISRKDKQGRTELAELVKAQITKLLDAEQIRQFEAALKRFDRKSRQDERKQRRKRNP